MSVKSTKFTEYYNEISKEMIAESSIFNEQVKVIQKQFSLFGLTNEQYSEVLSQLMSTSAQFLNQFSVSSTIELMQLEQKQPLIDSDVKLKEADLLLKDKELTLKTIQIQIANSDRLIKETEVLITAEELNLKKKQVELTSKEIEKATEEILVMKQNVLKSEEEAKLVREQVYTEQQKQSEVAASANLKQAQRDTELLQAGLVDSQAKLVKRQEEGYGDNLIIKAGEFQGGLASFAVNAGSDDAQQAITNFETTIAELKARA